MNDGRDCGEESVGGHKYGFVAHIENAQGDLERACAAVDGDRMTHADLFGKVSFERLAVFSQGQLSGDEGLINLLKNRPAIFLREVNFGWRNSEFHKSSFFTPSSVDI